MGSKDLSSNPSTRYLTMKLINLFLSGLASASDSAPLEDWTFENFSLQCGFTEQSVLTFEIYPADVDLDRSNFRAGNCTQNDLTFTRTAVDNSTIPESQRDYGRSRYTVSYNPETCTGITPDPADLTSYASEVTFDFRMGYVVEGTRLVTRPIKGGLESELKVFRQANYTDEVFQTENNMKGGEMAYFTIASKDRVLPGALTFAPAFCRLLKESCDENNNCNEITGLNLFNYTENACESAPILDFAISYDPATWFSQFRLFLFAGDVDESTFIMRCSIEVCTSACTTDTS